MWSKFNLANNMFTLAFQKEHALGRRLLGRLLPLSSFSLTCMVSSEMSAQ